jgi:hypothetical protein
MSAVPPRRKVPQVNLFAPPRRSLRLPIPGRYVELALIGLVALIWGSIGVAIALLLGWHP